VFQSRGGYLCDDCDREVCGKTMNDTIRELESLAAWVRSDPAVTENDDIKDNIARAIENRVRQLKRHWQLEQR